ncbi:hypothetical protein [Sansalvadorimonas verongulae]|uniref:hypothetical protein n=1 Tax=Sansalvadorimonas verongulae TaxID=2172824 RepID=UPI0012BD7FB4|nr:hypothetical protein [Sansalvadorimonas verongulae]MTI12814.1 hypothetical protein [Sansalvadorimonas verongulae]
MGLITRAQKILSRVLNRPDTTPSPRQENKYLPEQQHSQAPDTPLQQRSLTKKERIVIFINRYFLKPLHLFQGSIKTLTGETADTAATREAAEKLWTSFSDPEKAYVLIFPNSRPGFMNGAAHSAILMGNSHGIDMENTSAYSSWSFKGEGTLGPLNVDKHLNTFIGDYMEHGKPEVIEVNGLDIKAMKNMWATIQRNNRRYKLLVLNCSTVSSRIIRQGLPSEQRSKLYSPKGYWTPFDLKTMVEGMKASAG